MTPRVVTEPVIADVPLRPAAGPAPVFGASSAGSDLAQIAQAFGSISPTLARMGQQVGERRARSDEIAGQEAARVLEESKLDYHEAIKRGLIEPNDSPWFRYGLKKQGGVNAALKYQRELTAAVQELPDEATLADFESFEREWFDKWRAENIGDIRDDAFTQGFANSAAQARQGVALAFASRQNQASLKLFEEGLQSRLGSVVEALGKNASDEDYATAAEAMNRIVAEAQSLNPKIRSRLTSLLTGVLYAEALSRNDEGLFKRLASKLKGGTGAFDQITSVKLDFQKLTGEIIQKEERDRQIREVREAERKETAFENTLVEFSTAARDLKRWDLVDPEPFARKLEDQGMPEEASKVRQFAMTYRQNRFAVASQTVYKDLVARAVRGDLTASRVFDYIGTITPEQSITLVNLIQNSAGTGVRAEGYRNPLWQSALSGIRQSVSALLSSGKGGPEAAMSEAQMIGALTIRYDDFLAKYEREGKEPTNRDVAEFLNTNFEAVIMENAGGARVNATQMLRDYTGGKAFNIPEPPKPTELPLKRISELVRRFNSGQEFTAIERRDLSDALPGVDLEDRDAILSGLYSLINDIRNTNTTQP